MRPDSIAHYKISSKLGEGAMGEVYRATDSKLGREVAIKLLPEDFARDAARMARFTREAQVLASLNHPNIAAIYGVEDRALIMELVEGQTLAERIKQGPIPLEEALEIARQIADGLEAAHDKGIVHRDLKPANIKITPGGTVKLLDFGLAKADGPWATSASVDDAPTLTVATTGAGMILGTAAYMAPEQARGRNVDKRADIWAFGVILYEMLTGEQMFEGDTVTDVLASVVRQDPDLKRVPAKVRPLLERCLAKDPKRRLRDAGDAMLLLEGGTPAPAAATSSRTLVWALCGARRPARARTRGGVVRALPRDTAGRGRRAIPDRAARQRQLHAVRRVGGVARRPQDRLRRLRRRQHAACVDSIARFTDGRAADRRANQPTAARLLLVARQHVRRLRRLEDAQEDQCKRRTTGDHRRDRSGDRRHLEPGRHHPDRDAGRHHEGAGQRRHPDAGHQTASQQEPHAHPVFLPDGRHFLYLRGLPAGKRIVHGW